MVALLELQGQQMVQIPPPQLMALVRPQLMEHQPLQLMALVILPPLLMTVAL